MGGVRSCAAMKHMGLNVAADPFMSVANMGVNGGLVLSMADDPLCYSSQNEQDPRNYAAFARVPCLGLSDSEEMYSFAKEAFDISERLDTPVMYHEMMHIAYTRMMVEVEGECKEVEPRACESHPEKVCHDAGLRREAPHRDG
jgi:indolepyruvate ferredoxin oxidoreductase alpha subunit